MSRKDYKLLASALLHTMPIKRVQETPAQRATAQLLLSQWEADCFSIADALAADNVRFNRSRFLAACGVTDDE